MSEPAQFKVVSDAGGTWAERNRLEETGLTQRAESLSSFSAADAAEPAHARFPDLRAARPGRWPEASACFHSIDSPPRVETGPRSSQVEKNQPLLLLSDVLTELVSAQKTDSYYCFIIKNLFNAQINGRVLNLKALEHWQHLQPPSNKNSNTFRAKLDPEGFWNNSWIKKWSYATKPV